MTENDVKLLTKRAPKLLGKFSMKNLPTIYFVAEEFNPIDLTQLRDELSSLDDDDRFVIGSHPLCNIQINVHTIDEAHTIIRREGNYVLLYDASKFGTYVKKKKSVVDALQVLTKTPH